MSYLRIPVNPNKIPLMTHPYGAHWEQPDRSEIQLDDKTATMSQSTFDQLAEYSCSYPTGVYEGKMWKAEVKAGSRKIFVLRWYGESNDPDKCSNHQREIVIE